MVVLEVICHQKAKVFGALGFIIYCDAAQLICSWTLCSQTKFPIFKVIFFFYVGLSVVTSGYFS